MTTRVVNGYGNESIKFDVYKGTNLTKRHDTVVTLDDGFVGVTIDLTPAKMAELQKVISIRLTELASYGKI